MVPLKAKVMILVIKGMLANLLHPTLGCSLLQQREDVTEYLSQKSQEEEDRVWLNADLIETPQFEWKGEPPKGSPVKYVPGVGLIIEGDQSDAR